MIGKNIFILSPERWGTMKLSKHHYAMELASSGNRVFFLEPALLTQRAKTSTLVLPNLWIIKYPLLAKGRDRLPSFLYKLLLRWEVFQMETIVGAKPDIVWVFDSERLNRLRYFKNSINIFHPVDFFDRKYLKNAVFDIGLSTMQKQVEDLKAAGYPAEFLNHGLSDEFVSYGEKRLKKEKVEMQQQPARIKAGYVGNLLSEPPDRNVMRQVIKANSDVEFHFWGQMERITSNLASHGAAEVDEFISFLMAQQNVILHGPVDTAYLAAAMQGMDMFWICWNITKPGSMWNKYTNPHKVMEYLSTGRPVVTHLMETYKESDLVFMAGKEDNSDYLTVFEVALQAVIGSCDEELHAKRIKFSLSNSYRKHIAYINEMLTKINPCL